MTPLSEPKSTVDRVFTGARLATLGEGSPGLGVV